MEISLSQNGTEVSVKHKLINKNAWPVEVAAWGLTVMDEGGVSFIPQPQNEPDFLCGAKGASNITLWAYTRMDDERVTWGNKYITLKQSRTAEGNIKFGISNEDGWAAYLNKGNMFVNRFAYIDGAVYPDRGVSYETFTTDFMLEMETLSPLSKLEPNEFLIHEEKWSLFKGIEEPKNEDEIDDIVSKYITIE